MAGSALGDGVSFVVPVYNKEPWLPAVLDGLKAQRGPFRREFVFIDDGSTDGSLDLLRALTRDWPDARIITQANAGSAAATNRGIREARLSMIKFCDADDILVPDATRLLLEALAGRDDACLAWGERIFYRSLDDVQAAAMTPPNDCRVTAVDAPLEAAIRNSLFNPSQFLVRTDCARQVGGCDERVVFSQEYTLTLRLAYRWAFIKLHAPVTFVLDDAPGRLSGNRGRQLQRVTLALANFLRDHPDVPPRLQKFACQRAAGRAWKWRLRHHSGSMASPWFWHNVRSYLHVPADVPGFIETCGRAFDDAGPAVARQPESAQRG
jgi:glycosyltransferase involved in cell wall biosynthesis